MSENPALRPSADPLAVLPEAEQAEIRQLRDQLAVILAGVADPALMRPITKWIISQRGTRAANSKSAFLSDLRGLAQIFREAAEQSRRQIFLLPADPRVLANYIDRIGQVTKPSTMTRRMASLSVLHRAAGLESPTSDQLVKNALKRHARTKGTRTKQAQPIRSADIVKMIEAITGQSPVDLRDLVLLRLANDLGARVSELIDLAFEDLTETPEDGGATILLKRSKTDPDGAGEAFALAPTTLAAIKAWSQAVGIYEGKILRGYDLNKVLGDSLSRGGFTKALQRRAKLAGLAVDLTPHGFRVGMAQDILEAGASLPELQQAGRWKSIKMPVHYAERINAKRSARTRRFLPK